MNRKLTDKVKKKIMADHLLGVSGRQIAIRYGLSATTVSRVLRGDPAATKRLSEAQEQNTLEMIAYMSEQKGRAQKLMSAIIDAIDDPDKLARANVRDLATAYGIIADKFISVGPKNDEATLARAREILGGVDGVIK
jgi:IS30 family transposase